MASEFKDRVKIQGIDAEGASNPKVTADIERLITKPELSADRLKLYPSDDPQAVKKYDLWKGDGSQDSEEPYDDGRLKTVYADIVASGARPATLRELLLFGRTEWDRSTRVASIAETLEHPVYGTLCPSLFEVRGDIGVGEWVTRFEAMPAILVARGG